MPINKAVFRLFLLLICFAPLSINLMAQGIPPNILQIEIEDYISGEPLRVKALFTDDGELGECLLYFRLPSQPGYDYASFSPEYDYYIAEVPPEFMEFGHLEYYVYASDAEGNSRTSPEINPEDNPYRYSIVPDSEGKPTKVYLLSPEPGSHIPVGPELIIVSFFDPDDDTAPGSIQLLVDGEDVTDRAKITEYLITYLPTESFGEGKHYVEVVVRDYAGNLSRPGKFEFTVEKRKRKVPIGAQYSWHHSLDSKYDKYSGKEQPAHKPVDHTKPRLQGKCDWGWVKADGELFYNLYIDEDARSNADNRQTLNRYRLKLSTKTLDLIFGDANPRFSELTIKGTRIRGISADFDYGLLGLDAFYGASKNIINPYTIGEGDSVLVDSIYYPSTDSTEYVYQFGATSPTYKRDAFGVRMAAHFARNSDSWLNKAEWGISYMRFKDDTGDSLDFRNDLISVGGYDFAHYDSLEMQAYIVANVVTLDPDTVEWYWNRWEADNSLVEGKLGKPKDNIIASTTLDFRLFKKTYISLETAVSILNDNRYASRSLIDSSDDKDVQDIDKFMQNNFNFELNNEVNPIFPKAVFYADLRTPLPYLPTNFTLNYRRIPDTYNSLGNPSIQTDIDAIKAHTRTRLLKNRLAFSLGGETKKNNLYNAKDKTTRTNTYYTNVGLVLPEYPSINIGYRLITRDSEGLAKIADDTTITNADTSYNFLDSTYTENITSTFTAAVGYYHTYNDWRANINGNFMVMSYQDNKNIKYDFNNTSVMFSLALMSPWPVGLDLGGGVSINDPRDPDNNKSSYTIMNSRLSYYMFNHKLTPYVGLDLLTGKKDPDDLVPYGIDDTKRSFRLGFRWKISAKSSLAVVFENIDYEDNTSAPTSDDQSYTENRVRLKFDIRM